VKYLKYDKMKGLTVSTGTNTLTSESSLLATIATLQQMLKDANAVILAQEELIEDLRGTVDSLNIKIMYLEDEF